MGIFRLILAWFVVVSHTEGWSWIDIGGIAVAVFFFISGYLMCLAFESGYQFSSFFMKAKNFLINRFLRIFPLYWISLIFLVAAKFATSSKYPEAKEALSHVSTYLQNFFLLGLNQSTFWGGYFRFNNPAWSLDVELQYYLLVPFLVAAWYWKRWLIFLFLSVFSFLSLYLLLLPAGLVDIDRSLLAWSALFFAGFFFYHSQRLQEWARKTSLIVPAIVLCSGVAFFTRDSLQAVSLTLGLIIVASYLLVLQKEKRFGKFDHRIGDLSYPVYIFHFFILAVNQVIYRQIIDPLHIPFVTHFSYLLVTNIILTTLVAYLALRLVGDPIESARKKFKKMSPVSPSSNQALAKETAQ